MALPPSHPPSVPVLPAHPIGDANRELYFLRLRAETFRVELELESQLRLQGIGTLPPEWATYLEHQRQMILDRIQWMESREDDLTSSLVMARDPTHTLPSIWGHNESTTASCPIISPIRREESVRPFVLFENEGTLAFASICWYT
jgi:hypothetical protein